MAPLEQAALAAQIALAAAVLAGIVARGHWRTCWTFVLYLGSMVHLEGLILAAPARFFNLEFWALKESIQGGATLFLAVELGVRIFGRLEGARGIVGVMGLAALTAIAAAVVPAAAASSDAVAVAAGALPPLLYGTALLFAGLLAACLWYHVPLYPIHKAILLAFVPYLLAFTVGLEVLETFGWETRGAVNAANLAAFLAVLAYWAAAAWRRFVPADVAPAVLGRLQPWARAVRS